MHKTQFLLTKKFSIVGMQDAEGVKEIVREQNSYKKLGTRDNGSISSDQRTHFI